jgi:LmbE family N-acetylglucosaminyl deacetylase
VRAPHLDDEVLGCGGTIARHVAAGSDVSVTFLTDGRLGGVVVPTESRSLVEIRKAEARHAADILGIRTLNFLDAEDSRLSCDAGVATRLRSILERDRPEIVYLPFFMERHPDHLAANQVLVEATLGTSLRFECRGYEVWTPLSANCLVRIDDTIELKRRALGCYSSQLAQMDYIHGSLGLNAFRAMSLGNPPGRFAEAFHVQELTTYLRLYRAAHRAVLHR